jgi:outer membrane protein OmpA-like peptidoglycan-associated protein
MDGDGILDDRDSDRDGDGIPNDQDPCPNTPGANGSGCPEVPIEARNAIDFAIRNVYYETDKAEVKQESYDYLNRVIDWMLNHPEYKLDMQGHTDNRNSEDYNMVLSKNRVNNVKAYMIAKGVPAYRLKVEWFGETRPIASGNNESAWRKNRRVEMQWNFD